METGIILILFFTSLYLIVEVIKLRDKVKKVNNSLIVEKINLKHTLVELNKSKDDVINLLEQSKELQKIVDTRTETMHQYKKMFEQLRG